ncbi:N-acetylmuramic acid 6-phosphate etherase [Fundicoccus culcitae]|uniref:N-acetylmuramic acid 6-phosphate etherase n=1 Tax=Fundicoccus culcitae TaxID=2969821 RepID=A0ABY5PAI1_9LACT|nr:N-acetylmuramic acid 6-phosphate etherase [Fundicoccus culcitae]UUX35475.1 N-acetylmuramic acid 6-phosphate etherase [Fundicoccus culcitae]
MSFCYNQFSEQAITSKIHIYLNIKMIVEKVLPVIEQAVNKIIESFNSNGRLIYMGAGTSGRLGVLDAAECVPTFGVPPEMVVGLIAGGDSAIKLAVEGAEDSKELGKADLEALDLKANDTVVGIAASGRTPYVVGGLMYANEVGANTVSLACNINSLISSYSQIAIEVDCGPEVLTGSTRLKAGTAQKLILNMLSTASMIGIGKTYQNLMVDVQATNEKLVARSKRIIMDATDCSEEVADEYLEIANKDVKLAIVMILTGESMEEAKTKLVTAKGFISRAVENS